MSRFSPLALLIGPMVALAPGAETPPDERAAEAVLGAKGLVRSGKCYVLPKVDDAIQQLGLENMKLEISKARIGLQMAELEEANRTLEERRRAAISGPGGNAMTGTLALGGGRSNGPGQPSVGGFDGPRGPGFGMGDLSTVAGSGGLNGNASPTIQGFANVSNEEMVNRMLAGRASLERLGLQERQGVNAYVCARLLKQYDAVAADPEVKSAIRALNRASGAKLAVGPPSAYEHRMVVQAFETLRDKGLRANRGQVTFYPAPEDDVIRLAAEAEKARLQLLEPEKAGADPSRRLAESAGRRRAYLAAIQELRKRADDAQQRRAALIADPEVREALADLDKFRHPREKHRIAERKLDDALRRLALAEQGVVTRETPLEPDRDALWVEAAIGEEPRTLEMVVDPESPLVRISSKAAAELGLKLEGGDEVELVAEDGRTIRARKSTIGSIRVAGLVARDVPCLVLPGSAGDPPATLGGSFLNQFVATVDARDGRLTLVQINPRPVPEPEARH